MQVVAINKRTLNPGNTLAIILTHAGAFAAICWGFAYGFSVANWIQFVVLTVMTGFGITVGYHRMLTHRSFRCGNILRLLLSISGGMAGQGTEQEWVANHRVHHYFSDQDLDPHSPRAFPGIKGLLWAHVFWLFYKYERPKQYQRFQDLDADAFVHWQKRVYLPLVLAGLLLPGLPAGIPGILLAGFLRMVVVWHITWSVNSVCHFFGTPARDSEGRPYSQDDSRNNILVAILALGEGYHSNHHARPVWAYHGWNWYSIDASKWFIQGMELLGMARDVRKPEPWVVFKNREALEKSA